MSRLLNVLVALLVLAFFAWVFVSSQMNRADCEASGGTWIVNVKPASAYCQEK